MPLANSLASFVNCSSPSFGSWFTEALLVQQGLTNRPWGKLLAPHYSSCQVAEMLTNYKDTVAILGFSAC